MKIAQIGWAGNKNWGDERIFFCLKNFFYPHKIIKFENFQKAADNLDTVNSCDYVLIGGGGVIFRDINRYLSLINGIRKPLSCVGIGVESSEPDINMKEGIKLLIEKCDFIYVRSKRSKELFNNDDKVIVGPDLTFLYPYKKISLKKNNVLGINLRAWKWWPGELYTNLDDVYSTLDKYFPFLVRIYPFRKWNEYRCVRILKHSFKKIKPLPFYFGGHGMNDKFILGRYFKDVPSKNILNMMKKIEYLVGMRLHSLIFATQMGIPFVSLSYQPKNVNFCNEIGHPELSLNLFDYKKIKEEIKNMVLNHDEIRKDLLSYTEVSQKKCWEIMTKIKLFIEKTK